MFLVFSHLEVNALPQVLFPGLNDLTELLKVRRPVQINHPSIEKKKEEEECQGAREKMLNIISH